VPHSERLLARPYRPARRKNILDRSAGLLAKELGMVERDKVVMKDGAVVGLEINGNNLNVSASDSFQNYFSEWESALGTEQLIETYTSTSFLKSTGTSTVTIGPSTLTVADYTTTSSPETIPGCNGK